MKVLFVDHPEADYLAALVYLGLCQHIGAENVVDWPYKHTYHGQAYKGPVPYEPPNDLGVCVPFQWMVAQPGRTWSLSEVVERAAEFDLVVLASPRAYSAAALERLMALARPGVLRRLVMLDGEDYTAIRYDFIERFRPGVYFKLSLVPHPLEIYLGEMARVGTLARILPITFSSPRAIPARNKSIDVVFFGGRNWRGPGGRAEGAPPPEDSPAATLAKRLEREFPSFRGGNVPYPDYLAALASARIAVSVGGSGIEPLRTLEILACPGTLLAREAMDVISAHPLRAGETHAEWSTADELVDILHLYLQDEPARAHLAAAGNAHAKEHATPAAVARYLLRESLR